MQKLISLILTIICSTILFAQTAPQVKPGTHGAQEEYRIENSKINYSPVIEGESIITKISYVWTETINGSSKQLATTSTLSYTIPKVGSDQGTLVDISVRVTGISTDKLYKDLDTTLHYSIYVFKQPTVTQSTYDTALFVGDGTIMTCSHKGGKPDAWEYKWSDGTVGSNNTFVPKKAGDYTITLTINNTLGNNDKSLDFDTTLIYNISVWDRGRVTKADFKEVVCHGKLQTLSINTEGGYENGWTYKWTKVGDNAELSDSLSCELVLSNESSTIQTQTYQVEWKNAMGNNVGSQGIETFKINVYPKVIAPRFTYERLQMRDIESKEVEVTKGSGGNPNGWFYSWDREHTTNNFKHTFHQTINSSVKEVVEESLVLHWENRGPDGVEILDSANLELLVTIYNTPEQPVLKVKGNGTSNIYIIDDMGMSEEEMWTREYNFRFGDGSLLVSEVSNQRWCRYENTPYDAWAQSVWYYNDGFVCVSEPTKVSRGQYVASSKLCIRIYQLDGECVMHKVVDNTSSLESIYEGMNAGIYIVRIDGDGAVNTYKIVIK